VRLDFFGDDPAKTISGRRIEKRCSENIAADWSSTYIGGLDTQQPPKDLGNRFSVREQREPSVFGVMGVSFVLRKPLEVFVVDERNLALG
jgi:hypothetical protein